MSRITSTLLTIILTTSSAYAEEKVEATAAKTDEKSASAEAESEPAPEPSSDGKEQPRTDGTNTQAVSPEQSAEENTQTTVPDTDTTPTTAEPAATQPNTPPAPIAPQSSHGLTLEQWALVYERSGMTIKTGGYIGIGGGVLTTVGIVTLGTGALGLIGNEDKEEAGLNMVRGYLLAGFGLVAVGTGSALMAGGSVRQNKAVRQINPSAAGPGLGYAAWGSWVLGFTFPPATILSYVLSTVQKGQNQMYWNAASTTSALDQSKPGTLRVNLVPIHFQGNKGLALTGRF